MKFYDDEPIECDQCRKLIYAGEPYYSYDGKNFCSEDCLKEHLFENADYEEEYLMTASDHEEEYGDMRCHAMREEGW